MTAYCYNLALRFEKLVEEQPRAVAIDFLHDTLSYAGLNALSNQIAHFLQAKSIGSGQVVMLNHQKTAFGFASILACLKLGIIYVHLDENNPVSRLEKIIATCAPVCLLSDGETNQTIATVCDAYHLPIAKLALKTETLTSFPTHNLPETRRVTGNQIAYIMFTSSPSGVPKGAAITHDNVSNFIDWIAERYTVSRSDRFTGLNPIYFDNSVFDFYGSIFNGACLIPFPKTVIDDLAIFLQALEKSRCTIWFSAPSFLIYLMRLHALSPGILPAVRLISFGGEGFPKPLLQPLYQIFRDQATFLNVYGPTECTCICSAYTISDADFEECSGLLPLGQIADNFTAHVLSDNAPVIEGDIGELCLSGPNVGAGYYGEKEQTIEKFIQNPANSYTQEILYRTGDLVKETAKGLVFIGRKDNQIKHMGYRIELEEIENACQKLPYVLQAAAIYQASENGPGEIVACLILKSDADDRQIADDLRTLLPAYMIPTQFRRMKDFPSNANGKVDRRALLKRISLS